MCSLNGLLSLRGNFVTGSEKATVYELSAVRYFSHRVSVELRFTNHRVEKVDGFAKIDHLKAPRAPFNSQYRVIYPKQFLVPGSVLQKILASQPSGRRGNLRQI